MCMSYYSSKEKDSLLNWGTKAIAHATFMSAKMVFVVWTCYEFGIILKLILSNIAIIGQQVRYMVHALTEHSITRSQ